MTVHMPGYPCAVCGRASGSWSISLPGNRLGQFCSPHCMKFYAMAEGSLTQDEQLAVRAGGDKAGAYLDSLGKFDLRTLTEPEWLRFCGILFTETCAALRDQADDQIPF